MPDITEITDLSLPELDVYARLTDVQLRDRLEPEKGIFIAESPKVIELALNEGCEPLSLLTEARHIEGDARGIIERCGDLPVYTGSRELLSSLTGYKLTRGVLCAMRRPALLPAEAVLKDARRIAVLENVADATNIGAIFRCAAALGMDAVLVTPCCCDPFCRRAVRVSMGTVLQVPWTYIGSEPSEWPHPGLERLKDSGFYTVAMALCGDSADLDDPALSAREKLAIVLGAEGDGLSRRTIAGCDITARIPMSHGVDSLNVAAAAAVAFWQLRAR